MWYIPSFIWAAATVVYVWVAVGYFIKGDGWLGAAWVALAIVGVALSVATFRTERRRKNVDPKKLQQQIGQIVSIQNAWGLMANPGTSFHGGYRGAAQAHRARAVGGPIGGAAAGPGGGTGASVIDEFSGRTRIIDKVMEEAGFAVGVVRGVRSFKVDRLGRLTGVSYPQVWRPGENLATCRRNEQFMLTFAQFALFDGGLVKSPEPEPHALDGCGHGFYAYYDGSDDFHKEGMVSAVVEGYGEAVIGTRGFRCMKARIVALHIPDDVPAHLRKRVVANYRDVAVLDTFEQMVAEFPPDSAGNDYTPDSDPDFWTRSI